MQWGGQRRYRRDEAHRGRPLFTGVRADQPRRATLHVPAPERLVAFEERNRGGFVLITGRGAMGDKAARRHNVAMFNSSTATGADNWPERNSVYVNDSDAARLSVVTGDEVTLRNEQGGISCRVEVSPNVPAGHLYLSFHPDKADTSPNVLTSSDNIDPHTWQPLLKDTRVELVRVHGRR